MDDRKISEIVEAVVKNMPSSNLESSMTLSLAKKLALKVEEGMNYARFLDSQVRILKKGNMIRKALHLGNQ